MDLHTYIHSCVPVKSILIPCLLLQTTWCIQSCHKCLSKHFNITVSMYTSFRSSLTSLCRTAPYIHTYIHMCVRMSTSQKIHVKWAFFVCMYICTYGQKQNSPDIWLISLLLISKNKIRIEGCMFLIAKVPKQDKHTYVASYWQTKILSII